MSERGGGRSLVKIAVIVVLVLFGLGAVVTCTGIVGLTLLGNSLQKTFESMPHETRLARIGERMFATAAEFLARPGGKGRFS